LSIAQFTFHEVDAVAFQTRERSHAGMIAQQHARLGTTFEDEPFHQSPAQESATPGYQHVSSCKHGSNVGDIRRASGVVGIHSSGSFM
jgi:hypothetical protein